MASTTSNSSSAANSSSSATEVAFVTGASGFVAQHLISQLLAKKYKVVGTVRSDTKGKKIAGFFNNSKFSYEVVPDITKAGAFDHALSNNSDVTVVYHTASPYTFTVKDIEAELLKPAIEGTKSILHSTKAHGKNVKKFVLTSSYVAIGLTPGYDYADKIINEDSWTEIDYETSKSNTFFGYLGSKTLAEKAAWDFVKTQSPAFAFAVVAPPYIFGPQAFPDKDVMNSSTGALAQFLSLKPTDEYPQLIGGFVDVRDVAKSHIIAGENPDANGQRLMIMSGGFNSQLVANVLRKKFPQLQKTIPQGHPESAEEMLKSTAGGIPDNSRTRKIINFAPIDFETSVADTIKQIL